MIKHLRRRFTAVLMSLLGTVMLIVLGSVYVSMYRSENMNTDRIINFAMNLEMHNDNTDPPPQSPPDGTEEPPKDFEGDIHFDSFFFPQRTRHGADDISTENIDSARTERLIEKINRLCKCAACFFCIR